MKKIFFLLLTAMITFTLHSCGGGDDSGTSDSGNGDTNKPADTKPEQPTTPSTSEFESPTDWYVTASYADNMHFYILMPEAISENMTENDQLAVFCGTECRGRGIYIDGPNGKYWDVYPVVGNNGESLSVMYYSTKTRHIYKSSDTFVLYADQHYGEIDSPKTLSMKKVTKE